VLAGVLPFPTVLPNPGVVQTPISSTVGVGGPRWVWADRSRDRRGSCRGGDPSVSVVMTVHSSEGTVLIDYQTVTAVELAAARRAGSPS
jgi:hypothetical protein